MSPKQNLPPISLETAPEERAFTTVIRLGGDEILSSLEDWHFVREAPFFADQVDDITRTNTITCTNELGYHHMRRQPYHTPSDSYEITEHDGLMAVGIFLEESAAVLPEGSEREIASEMRNNLTFIGEKEFEEATQGIAEAWKAYLDRSSDNTIGITLGVLGSDTAGLKSGAYMLERVLSNFSEEDWLTYGDRIEQFVFWGNGFSTEVPDYITKMILLDDWLLSGGQADSSIRSIREGAHFQGNPMTLEMQLIAAPDNFISNGFQTTLEDGIEVTTPVRTYFKAHSSSIKVLGGNEKPVESYITGAHSAGDYSFAQHLERMAVERQVPVPPLAEIVRSYKDIGALPNTDKLTLHEPVKND